MSLMNAAINNFKTDRTFALNPSDAESFANAVEMNAQKYGYIGETARVATTCTFAVADPNEFLFADKKNIIATWNQITGEDVQNNATMLFGDRTFTVTPDNNKDLVTPTADRVEITPHGANFTALRKVMMHQRFLSAILAAQYLAMIGKKRLQSTQDRLQEIQMVQPRHW